MDDFHDIPTTIEFHNDKGEMDIPRSTYQKYSDDSLYFFDFQGEEEVYRALLRGPTDGYDNVDLTVLEYVAVDTAPRKVTYKHLIPTTTTYEYMYSDGNVNTGVNLSISSEYMPEIYSDEGAYLDDFLDGVDDYELYGGCEPFHMGHYVYNTCMPQVHGNMMPTRTSVLDAKYLQTYLGLSKSYNTQSRIPRS
jgi:hypothetical protein